MTHFRRLYAAVGAWRTAKTAWDSRPSILGPLDSPMIDAHRDLAKRLADAEYEMARAHVACGAGPRAVVSSRVRGSGPTNDAGRNDPSFVDAFNADQARGD